MIIYLSLRQILLNQINVLLRKQQDKNNDDPERIQRRLNNLQTALEQIKSYEHNATYKYVIKHFNIELSESEQREIRDLSKLYDDGHSIDGKRGSKTGFTTQRSETLFTGAAVELNDNNYYGSDNEMDDEKTPRYGLKAPQWIHYRGFAHWLRKQSFIKFNKRNDQEKYRKIWNNLLGLHFINQWDKGKIKPRNIIGPYGTSNPYIAIYQSGTTDIVKASLLRLSMTQNRIFRFKIDREDASGKSARSRSRARRSVDMDNDDEPDDQEAPSKPVNANQLVHGLNLFNQVTNKDTLRIVATMLWDTSLANSVLEELLHNARFSMYGLHAKNIADTIAKEMNLMNEDKTLSFTPDYNDDLDQQQLDEQQAPSASPASGQQQTSSRTEKPLKVKDITHGGYDQVGTTEFPQFSLPSPQRPVTMKKQKEIAHNDFGAVSQPNNNNNGNSNTYQSDHHQQYQQQQLQHAQQQQLRQQQLQQQQLAAQQQQQQQARLQQQQQKQRQNENAKGGSLYNPQFAQQNNNTHDQWSNHHGHGQQVHGGYKSTPEPIPEEPDEENASSGRGHKGHSGSVVFHDNIRESEIMEAGFAEQQQSYDPYNSDGDDEDESGYDENHQHH